MTTFTITVEPRAGEDGIAPQRSSRFYAIDSEWYFNTREGAPIGPFSTRREAAQGLRDFLEFMALAEPKTLSRLYAALSA